MSFTQHGDIKFFYDGVCPADIAVESGGFNLLRDPGFETAVLISIFSDARAGDEDKLPDKNGTGRGWWADSLAATPIGSKLWLLERAKLVNSTTSLVQQYTADALAWLTSDEIADSVEVVAFRNGIYRIDTEVTIKKTDNSKVFFKYFLNWQAQIYGGF